MTTDDDKTEPPAYDEPGRKMLQCEVTLKLKRELDVLAASMRRTKTSIVRQALEEFSERNGGPTLAKEAAAHRFENYIWVKGRF